MSCPSQLYHIYKAVNIISRSTFFVIAFFCISESTNFFCELLSWANFQNYLCDHGRPNPGFSEANHESSEERKIHPITGFYYFKIRKITKLIHTEKNHSP